jgi:hypothetical protein
LIVGTALAVLVGAGAASAAFNNYSGSGVSFSPRGAGSPAHPKPVNMTETLLAGAAASTDRAAPLTSIRLKVYGVRTNGNLFPTCTDGQIEANKVKYERACPSQSRVAQGGVHSLLGPASNPSQAAAVSVCNPYLRVFNGGRSSQVFFFTTAPDAPGHTCGGLTTGSTAPYDGHISYQGKWWVLNISLPADISNKVANQPGLYGSLIREVLNPVSETKRVHGQTRGYMESVGCQGHKRPYSITFTASTYGSGAPETQTISGSTSC